MRDLLDLYRVTDPEIRAFLLGLAASGQTEDWWSAYGDVVKSDMFADHLLRYVELEQDALELSSWEPELFHGLLQAEGYAAAVAGYFFPNHTEQERGRFVKFRLRRQDVLRAGDDREFTMFVSEGALLRPVGGPRVMAAQLETLHASLQNDLSGVDFRVLPLEIVAPASIGGPFVVMGFGDDDDRDVVYLENRESADYKDLREKIEVYRGKIQELGDHALSRDDSLARLAEALKYWDSRA